MTNIASSASANTRRAAFDKLAKLAARSPTQQAVSDIDRLFKACNRPRTTSHGFLDGVLKGAASTSRVPMGVRELDILLALCKAAASISSPEHANRLVSQLVDYLPDSHIQLFRPSPFLNAVKPSPSEALTYHLCSALLNLAAKHPKFRDTISGTVSSYIRNVLQTANAVTPAQNQYAEAEESGDIREAADVASIAVSLVGFLEAASASAHFWSSSEKLEIIKTVRSILSDTFMVAVETASSTIRNSIALDPISRDWRRYIKRYAASGRPLGAMLLQHGFMGFIKACSISVVAGGQLLSDGDLLGRYLGGPGIIKSPSAEEMVLMDFMVEIIADEINLLEDGSDYLRLSSSWQQRLAFSVKKDALLSFLNCVVLNEDAADADTLLSWLDETLADPVQMVSPDLAIVTLKCVAVTARTSSTNASNLCRSLLRFIVQSGASSPVIAVAAYCLAHMLRLLSQDSVISTLYSLGNVLSASSGMEKPTQHLSANADGSVADTRNLAPYNQPANGSVLSFVMNGDDETYITHRNVVQAVTTIATTCNDSKIIALAQSMLLQKIGRIDVAVDACIIEETAALARHSENAEFQLLLKLYVRVSHDSLVQDNHILQDAVHKARVHLAVNLERTSVHYRTYLIHLLESIVNQGDVIEREHSRRKNTELSVEEITPLLKPLALLVSSGTDGSESVLGRILKEDDDIPSLFRDVWFNIAVHGICLGSKLGQQYYEELRVLAQNSPSLVAENRAELLESEIELNTVLRRGMSPEHTAEEKKNLINELPGRDSDIKRLTYPKTIFLNAALLIETLRAASGDCTKVFTYFLDPALNNSEMGNCMSAVADKAVTLYLSRSLSGKYERFSAPYVSQQLAKIFAACCHRIEKVQQLAAASASKIINQTPSALCEQNSLFTLLELLTVMWSSCLDGELDEFGWQSSFTSPRGIVTIELSDNYEFRKHTLDSFHRLAKKWVLSVMNIAPLDVKGLLQTYLSDYEDDGAYGHIALGRSFALEMGSIIPPADQRLGSIDRQSGDIMNVASDFISQYTTRQEYRSSEAQPIKSEEWHLSASSPHLDGGIARGLGNAVQEAESVLSELEVQTSRRHDISIEEIRKVLRRAAALLCCSADALPSIIHHLVAIPFQVFTKESIKLGISLWLGVINENSRTEPRILSEVAQAWERTISRKQGLFDPSFDQIDPFYSKMEFQPSDKESIARKQQIAQSVITPHLRILQFFESHFNAIRLGSAHTQRVFPRLVSLTLTGLANATGHPLAREVHFRIVLFGLNVLKYCTGQDRVAQWKLKDQILSAALRWFQHPPRWSFGGNRLQMKAEDRILSDVEVNLETVASIGAHMAGSYKSLQTKQDLVRLLLENERSRLRVWLYPLEHEKRHILATGSVHKTTPEMAVSFLRLAWAENPSLAIQLASRFPSPRLRNDVRWLLLNFPEKALDEPDSLELLFGSELPADVSFQLKYLLYWAPVNPVSAATYFLPAYGNHPFILQYAMRALESHSIDISFFYVPQLVQALRYDALGYVERYIFETAQMSQLFAHQVIWNMKANAYKDEDSQIPDPLKPTLDRFMESVIRGFTEEDQSFYEREFSFFNEVTGVSGKLRPFIKKSKPEKKQKIEEELRKIKVEVGVYLPSNPDGVVIGIDRKSGKPLQSHAKAPYMATFRIRKTKAIAEEDGKEDSRVTQSDSASLRQRDGVAAEESYEVWQSAIFKVGDDCRQDVLALQMIATFRSIFSSVGLDVFVYPYRVTATAPGCGVIDVLPNSISRDMLGREAVNGLYDYFVSKYGGEDSIRFQEARTNFVKSMAAYSVISYLLQFKDRHNGNIMIDDAGHIIHIDFGFCFDIAPGGVRFERAPFKLTTEMIAVMGGQAPHHDQHPGHGGSSTSGSGDPVNSQAYRWFESLTVKAFLAARPYTSKLSNIVCLMIDSGLPCFKPDTLKNFHDRFVLDKSEREAADYMRDLVKKSYASYSTKGYDQFQLLTNGIPY